MQINVSELKSEFEKLSYKSTEAAVFWLMERLFNIWEKSVNTPYSFGFDYINKVFKGIIIEHTLLNNNGNIHKASDYLRMNRTTLLEMINRVGLSSLTQKYEAPKIELTRKCKKCGQEFVGDSKTPCPCGNNIRSLIKIQKPEAPRIRY